MTDKIKISDEGITLDQRKELLECLDNGGGAMVTFLKKDLTKRTMFCTRSHGMGEIDPDYDSKDVLDKGFWTVYDLEKSQIRAFRLDTIVDYIVVSKADLGKQ